MDFRVAGQNLTTVAKGVFLIGMAASLVLMSGCQAQKAEVKDPDAAILAEPVVDARLAQEDFGFPSAPPSLKEGKEVFETNCASCHASGYWQNQKTKENIAYTTPIDTFIMLSSGQAPAVVYPNKERKQVLPKNHPAFKEKLNRDERWAAIFYARYMAGAGDMPMPNAGAPEVANIFGGNCAVCHGSRGFADGPLHIGKTGNHELHDAQVFHNLNPAPANFHQYDRMYNRTDAQLFKYVCEGIYPSAMPSWYGNVTRDKDTGKIVYVFDDKLIWSLVRHVRTYAYKNDLPEGSVATAPKGLMSLQACNPKFTNRPWTKEMVQQAPNKAFLKAPGIRRTGDDVYGGMTFQSRTGEQPTPHVEHASQREKH